MLTELPGATPCHERSCAATTITVLILTTLLPYLRYLLHPHCMRQVLATIKQATETVEMTPDKVEQQARGRDKHRAFGWTMELTAAISLNGPFLRQACNRRHGPGSRAISRGPLRRCFGSLPCKRDESLQPQHRAPCSSPLPSLAHA